MQEVSAPLMLLLIMYYPIDDLMEKAYIYPRKVVSALCIVSHSLAPQAVL